jgi:hypothetical protein
LLHPVHRASRPQGLSAAPKTPDTRDQADRDAIASSLMRYRDENGQRWANVIDLLTMYPDARRRVVRLLGEMQTAH